MVRLLMLEGLFQASFGVEGRLGATGKGVTR